MITCDGDKFVIARWIYDANIEALRGDGIGDLDDEMLVKLSDVAVLRNSDDFNKLGTSIQEQLKEFYADDNDEPGLFDATVWSWHIPDPQPKPIPHRMILFRGEQEVCTVWFEQVEQL